MSTFSAFIKKLKKKSGGSDFHELRGIPPLVKIQCWIQIFHQNFSKKVCFPPYLPLFSIISSQIFQKKAKLGVCQQAAGLLTTRKLSFFLKNFYLPSAPGRHQKMRNAIAIAVVQLPGLYIERFLSNLQFSVGGDFWWKNYLFFCFNYWCF